ncbi:MAG: hydrogenase iron-sulfur subunit [Rhodospirillaceae bacterium]|nr:hydrogenase iron-sulfur subunit [Rhodospirillaceae bacterium]
MKQVLRFGFAAVENALNRAFGFANPLHHLGALGLFFFWVIGVSGVYIFIFFDTGATEAFLSVEAMTREQWYAGGIMRSLHRYASDGLVAVMVLHIAREFAFDRLRGPRWLSWVTGTPIIWLVMICGITGYWLVWDTLAQFVALATAELLDWLPIFAEPIARNFSAPSRLDDRFFTLVLFAHIAVPLVLVFVLWLHLQRVASARIHPPRALALGTMAMLLAMSLVAPALSQGPANLAAAPAAPGLDWFYLWSLPLAEVWGGGAMWAFGFGATLVVAMLPWLPPLARRPVAVVDLENCNGCTRCAADCPVSAIDMGPRTDGKAFRFQAVVDADLCVACGLCMGACPTATPFRRVHDARPGIDLPDFTLRQLRDRVEAAAKPLAGEARVLAFHCETAARPATDGHTAAVAVRCLGMIPPAMIDYLLSRRLADGVALIGCGPGQCHYRLGNRWTRERIAAVRDPHLRARVPRERLLHASISAFDGRRVGSEIEAFRATLSRDRGARDPAAREAAS